MKGQSTEERAVHDQSFPGKIAVVTVLPSIIEDDFHSVDYLVAKYGKEKILHITWPENIMTEQDKVIDTVAALAQDREIKVLILNQAIPGSNAAVDKFKKTRNDVFIIYCTIHEQAVDAVRRANLLLRLNELGIGPEMVKQARKQGAKAFVHYTFPRHMEVKQYYERRDTIRKTCAAEGLQYVDAEALDPAGKSGIKSAQRFILEDVPKFVAKYGKDTAFFATCCQLQASLIKAVVECRAIYPQPCCPSPSHGFPEALCIDKDRSWSDLHYLIGEASRIAGEKNMTDRLSTWPVSASTMFTSAGAEYAIKWINGEVLKTSIDEDALVDCMNDFIENAVGEKSCIFLDSYSEGGIKYHNYKLVLMGYLDF